MKAGISWSALPAFFQKAIGITHRLGLRYIWIDALCIIQVGSSEGGNLLVVTNGDLEQHIGL